MHGVRIALSTVLIFLLLVFAACSRTDPHARHYELRGTVVAVDRNARMVMIAHEKVEGYMDAMTMPFVVKDDWALEAMKPGARVTAVLVVSRGRSWIENPVISSTAATPPEAGKPHNPMPGDRVPGLPLVQQDGSNINLTQYHGKVLILTFIYTRCPLPDYCPLMTGNFQKLDALLHQQPALYRRTHLLSVTIDPEYDTPAVMRKYGAAFAGKAANDGFAHWEFATGSRQQVANAAMLFGLQSWTKFGQIVHDLRTAVITPDGKIYKVYRGNEWKPAELAADAEALLASVPGN